jgi:tetratricopeptide (TPR) repeat protein
MIADPLQPAPDGNDGLTRLVAVLIAVSTFLGGFVGFLQARASAHAGEAGERAQRLAVEAMGALSRAQQDAQVDYETFALAIEQRTRAANVRQEILSLGTGPDAKRLELEQQRWLDLAARTEAETELGVDSPDGPVGDPGFPTRYFSRPLVESWRLGARQDAANEAQAGWDADAASYTAAFAIIAVAVYLLGLSLTVRDRRIRTGFVAVAIGLVSTAGVLSTATALDPPRGVAEESADAYAEARLAYQTAYSQADFQAAVPLYDRVIELRPTFARSYLERSSAIFLGATPQRGGFASIAAPEALARARADLDRARELGLSSAEALGQQGFYAFVEGIQEGRQDILERSIAASRAAIAADPANPLYRYNLGVALVAAGRVAEAQEAYDRAVERTVYIDEAMTELRQEPVAEQQWVAGALTDLEIVRRHRPELGADIDRLAAGIVGRVSSQSLQVPQDHAVSVGPVELSLYPGELQWQAELTGYDPERDVITTEWLYDDPGGMGWSVLASVSGVYTPGTSTDGREFVLVSYLGSLRAPECLPDGRYRVDIWIGGRRAATAEVDASLGGLAAYRTPDLRVALCRPGGWQPAETELPGFLRGTVSPEGDRGMHIFRVGLTGTLQEFQAVSETLMQGTVGIWGDLLPGTPTYDEARGTTHEYFMGLERPAWQWHTYPGGQVRSAAGLADDGSLIIAMLFGPDAWFEEDEPYLILDSMALEP